MQIQHYFTIIHIRPAMHKTHILQPDVIRGIELAFGLATRWSCLGDMCAYACMQETSPFICMCQWFSSDCITLCSHVHSIVVVCLLVCVHASVYYKHTSPWFCSILTDIQTALQIIVMIICIPPTKYWKQLQRWQMLLGCYCRTAKQMTPHRAVCALGS